MLPLQVDSLLEKNHQEVPLLCFRSFMSKIHPKEVIVRPQIFTCGRGSRSCLGLAALVIACTLNGGASSSLDTRVAHPLTVALREANLLVWEYVRSKCRHAVSYRETPGTGTLKYLVIVLASGR